MPRGRQVPTVDAFVSELARKVGILERRLQAVVDARRIPEVFSFSGLLDDAVGIESPAWRPVHPVSIDLLVPLVLVAPSGGDLTIDINLRGPTTGLITTLTIPDGETYAEVSAPFVVPMGGSVTATITDSNGAESLSISMLPRLL